MIYHYTDDSPIYGDLAEELRTQFDLADVIENLLNSNDPEKRRVGSYSKSIGWSCQNYKQKEG